MAAMLRRKRRRLVKAAMSLAPDGDADGVDPLADLAEAVAELQRAGSWRSTTSTLVAPGVANTWSRVLRSLWEATRRGRVTSGAMAPRPAARLSPSHTTRRAEGWAGPTSPSSQCTG